MAEHRGSPAASVITMATRYNTESEGMQKSEVDEYREAFRLFDKVRAASMVLLIKYKQQFRHISFDWSKRRVVPLGCRTPLPSTSAAQHTIHLTCRTEMEPLIKKSSEI